MASECSTDEIFQSLYAQAKALWGEEDAERQRQALRLTAAEMTTVARCEVPPDLEPRFF